MTATNCTMCGGSGRVMRSYFHPTHAGGPCNRLTEGYCEKIALSPWDVPKEPAKPSEDPAVLKSLADQCCDAMVRLRYQLDGCREANKKR